MLIVALAVGTDDDTDQTLLFEHGKGFEGARTGHEVEGLGMLGFVVG
jgi:hypothetical protein